VTILGTQQQTTVPPTGRWTAETGTYRNAMEKKEDVDAMQLQVLSMTVFAGETT